MTDEEKKEILERLDTIVNDFVDENFFTNFSENDRDYGRISITYAGYETEAEAEKYGKFIVRQQLMEVINDELFKIKK